MMHVRLPDRATITLREAVTAFVYGESCAVSSGPFDPSDASNALLDRLHEAAHAGRVRFHALPAVGNNKYQEIDPLYFGAKCTLNWNKNEILSSGLVDERECKPIYDGQECDEVLGVDWCDVHVDREQFAQLLKDMGISVEPQKNDIDVAGKRKTFKSGGPGRDTSKHLILPEAKRRIAAGEYPKTLAGFSRELAEWLETNEPLAAPMTAGTIENAVRELWNKKPTKS